MRFGLVSALEEIIDDGNGGNAEEHDDYYTGYRHSLAPLLIIIRFVASVLLILDCFDDCGNNHGAENDEYKKSTSFHTIPPLHKLNGRVNYLNEILTRVYKIKGPLSSRGDLRQ